MHFLYAARPAVFASVNTQKGFAVLIVYHIFPPPRDDLGKKILFGGSLLRWKSEKIFVLYQIYHEKIFSNTSSAMSYLGFPFVAYCAAQSSHHCPIRFSLSMATFQFSESVSADVSRKTSTIKSL